MTQPEYQYPIDSGMQMPQQAKASSMRAKELNLIVGSRIFDFSNPVQVKAYFDELGPNARRPKDDGVYHLFWIQPYNSKHKQYPLLKPQEEVRPFLQGMAAADMLETVQYFADQEGFLPLDDPTED